MAQRKNPQLDALHQSILRKMQQLPENKTCADCKGPSPRWASTNLGIFVCISCSGIHRKLGTHISQVRSITLDTWTPAQIAHFQKLGNAKAASYFEACIPEGFRRPSAGDSMAMERFIRDKYEKKRFITVENGGLGGAANARELRRATPLSNPPAPRTNAPTLGARPSQLTSEYDAPRGPTRRSTPLSYSDTFRSAGPAQSPPSTITRTHMSTNPTPFNSSRSSLSKPGNAIQRASTVREIMNMGFPAELAARAAEAAEGDLQRAVDWVLANSPDAHQPPPQKQQPVRDLLDFGDPTPPQKTNGVPGAMALESLIKPDANKTSSGVAQDDFADFADFGAFESALPAASATASSTKMSASQTITGSLSSSISGLYAQGTGVVAGASVAQQQRVGNMPMHAGHMGVARPGGLPASPQQATLSSATGMSHISGIGTMPRQAGQPMAPQVANARLSPQHAPLSRSPNAQFRPGFVQGSPGGGLGYAKASSPGGRPLGMHQNSPFKGTQVFNMMHGKGFSKLPGAGSGHPGVSVQSTRPAAVQSPSRRQAATAPDAIPSFTWPAGSKPIGAAKGVNSSATPVLHSGATGPSTPSANSVPPPPPPPEEVQIAGGEGVPPPPEGPPPSNHSDPKPAGKEVNGSAEQAVDASSANHVSSQGGAAMGTGKEEEEDEDPFAALSMLALSSATSKQKAKQRKPVTSTAPVETKVSSNAPVSSETTSLDLDNLLG